MKKIIGLIFGIIFFLNNMAVAHADSPLNGDDIQHFMNAMKPLQELGEKYNFENDDQMLAANSNMADFSPMSNSLEVIKSHEAYGEFKKVIRAAGFSDATEWANIGDRVMKAYMSLKMTEQMTPEKMQEMQKNIEEIKKNEYLSSEMKERILNSLGLALSMGGNMSEEDKADRKALRPYLAKLDRLFEESR